MKCSSALLVVCGVLSAQEPQNQVENVVRMAAGSTPIYRVTVTERSAKAINYQHRSGATKIDFRGTDLMYAARGEAKVEGKQGYIEIEVEFDDLQPADHSFDIGALPRRARRRQYLFDPHRLHLLDEITSSMTRLSFLASDAVTAVPLRRRNVRATPVENLRLAFVEADFHGRSARSIGRNKGRLIPVVP